MRSDEKYRIGMFRDTGMTPEAIAKQLNHRVKTIKRMFAEIDADKSKEHHFKRVDVVVQVWDAVLKRYVDTAFEIEVDFKSMPYQEGVEKIADSIRKAIEPDIGKLL
jgi:IS30 family transposase